MTSPFREPDELPKVDAADALAKLELAEPTPLVFKLAYFWRSPYEPSDEDEPIANERLRAEAEAIGFMYRGRYSFPSLRFGRKPRECWIDGTRVVKLSLRRAAGADAIERQMSKYFLETMFDDGATIVTWGKRDAPFVASGRAMDRPGTEHLSEDYASHMRAVVDYTELGHNALIIADLATALRIGTWYDSRLRPIAAPMIVKRNLILLALMLGIVAIVLRK
jgi:hypothetical protein